MGIKNLYKIIKTNAPEALSLKMLSDYKGQIIGIDASLTIYQLHSIGVKHNIVNKNDKYINHIQGLFFRTLKLILAGITPCYIFDGKPPDAKIPTLAVRKAVASRIKMTNNIFEDCKQLLNLMGVPIVQAPTEAEAEGAALVRTGIIDAFSTEDLDSLVFGSSRVIKGLDNMSKNNKGIVEINLKILLEKLSLNMNQFIDLCILLGCDYTKTIPTIGPSRALLLMHEHGSIEKILIAKNLNKKITNFNYVHARELFIKPKVVPVPKPVLKKLTRENIVQLKSFLHNHGLDDKRIDNGINKLYI